jgi:hypothetical protein
VRTVQQKTFEETQELRRIESTDKYSMAREKRSHWNKKGPLSPYPLFFFPFSNWKTFSNVNRSPQNFGKVFFSFLSFLSLFFFLPNEF